jgi:deazaflavin-dependent oxidoreductase (nitroreductase family)
MPLRRVDPPARRGPLFRLLVRLFTTAPVAWFSRRVLWKLDPRVMRLTGGRIGLTFPLPTAVLETTGARSGATRHNVVIYFHDGDRITLVASKLGAPENPAWFHNAKAHPDVRFGGLPFRATVIDDEAERARLFGLADRVFPPYAMYRERAARAGRAIPIIQLEAPTAR